MLCVSRGALVFRGVLARLRGGAALAADFAFPAFTLPAFARAGLVAAFLVRAFFLGLAFLLLAVFFFLVSLEVMLWFLFFLLFAGLFWFF